MKKTTTLLLLFFVIAGKMMSQTYLPVPATGYGLDAIAENTPAISTTGSAIDGSDYVLFSQSYGAIYGSTYGLPNTGIISSATRTFQLQNYTGPNLLYILASLQDSLMLVTPTAFTDLSLLGFATEGPATMSVTVRFTDNTTQVFSSISVNDWFNTVPVAFYSGFDRAGRGAGTPANVGINGNPRLFTHDMAINCANQGKKVKTIMVKNTSTARVCMLALSGIKSPLALAANPTSFCNSGTATLTASSATTYTWLPVGAFAGSNSASVAVSPASTTNYTVQTTTPANCVISAVVTINVFTGVPSLTLASTSFSNGACPGRTLNLNASGATTYTWSGSSVAVTNNVPFVPAATATYVVTGENTCGTSTAAISVSLHPLPSINTTVSSSTLCAGGTLTLSATGNGTNYVWSGAATTITNGVGFAPVTSAIYSVTATSSLGCSTVATVPTTVYVTPTLVPVASPSMVCIGGSTTLTAVGALTYTWVSASQTVNTNTFMVTPTGTGVTTYTVIKANSVCMDTKVISITTNSLPAIAAFASPGTVCALSPATLAVGGALTYTWTAPGTPGYTFTGASNVITSPVSAVYTVAASDGTCISNATASLTVTPNPTVTVSAPTSSICNGQSITITASGGNTYTWTTPAGTLTGTSITQSPTTAVSYNVIGDDGSGCTAQASQIILVYAPASITVQANKNLVCSGGAVTFTASGASTYTWDPSAGSVISNITTVNPVRNTSGFVTYSVSGTSTAGCIGTQTAQVNVYVPSLSVTGGTNACKGGTLSLLASGGNSGSYSWNTGSGSPVSSAALTTSISAPATFTVSASTTSLALVCPASQTVAVGLFADPTVAITPDRNPICFGESCQLVASGGTIYTWTSSSNTTATLIVKPLIQTNYTVTGIDVNGCIGTGTLQLKVSTCAGLNEQQQNSLISIYPNPNSGEFTIQSASGMSLILVNELGQLVQRIELSETNNYKASVKDLPGGIYFVSGSNDTSRISQKIIVTR